jgi:hypothetical protein
VPLSIDEVRMLLSRKLCHICGKKVLASNWTLDRKDNELSHTVNNLQLACLNCNRKKKDSQPEMYMWDCETYPEPPNNCFQMYSVGFLKYDEESIENEDYNSMIDATQVIYGMEAQERFENFLLENSEEVRRTVDRRLNSWLADYEENHTGFDKMF